MKYKFTVHVKQDSSWVEATDGSYIHDKTWYWFTGVSRNGKTVFVGETYKRKGTLLKTINNLFPGVEIKMP